MATSGVPRRYGLGITLAVGDYFGLGGAISGWQTGIGYRPRPARHHHGDDDT